MIYWIFGQTGAGKSTLARKMAREYNRNFPISHVAVLDGDELRAVWPGLGLSSADRREQNLRAARLAKLLADQGLVVIVATICPFADLRAEVDAIVHPTWIYLPGGHPIDDEHPFETPQQLSSSNCLREERR